MTKKSGSLLTRRAALTAMVGGAVFLASGCTPQELDPPDQALIDVRDFGAILDGATDCTVEVQAAAEVAAKRRAILYIPAGELRVAKPVYIAASIRCEGIILIDVATSGSINIVRSTPPVTVQRSKLTGLDAGSYMVGGLDQQTGDLWLNSAETLIVRNNGTPGQVYNKSELSRVVSNAGLLSQPLALSYATVTPITAILYPPEREITVDGLHIEVDGTTGAHPAGVLGVFRSDVTLNNLITINESRVALPNAVIVRQSANIEFNRPHIRGFALEGAGYGIARYNTVDVRINAAHITECRHGVSGLWNKTTIIDGGVYEGGLDDHWCWGLRVNNVNSTVGHGRTHIQAAGADVIVTGGQFTGGRNVIGIREDTPELTGIMSLRGGWQWTPSQNQKATWLVGYTTPSLPSFDYGRTLGAPEHTEIVDGVIVTIDGAVTNIVDDHGVAFARRDWSNITIDNVRIREPSSVN